MAEKKQQLIDVAETKLEQRTIRHSLFTYDLPGGGQAVAMRGATVDLLPADVERGEKFDAFTENVGDAPDAPSHSTLPEFQVDASDAERRAWVESGSVPEIVAAVNARPEILPHVLAAEQSRKGEARKTLVEALGRIQGAE